MRERLIHRGPDDVGSFSDDLVAFGHTRLSIVDVEHGRQPISNEDDSIVVVYNGEIYNFGRLRTELEGRGHHFRTDCDSEIIPHLYEEYGDGLVEHLQGMFAFALYDRRGRRVLLARDHLGIKPLYYADRNGRLTFASEIKALLADPDLPRTLNQKALHDFLSLLYCLPPDTFFQEVRELQPGTILTSDGRGKRVRHYWQPELNPTECSERDALARFRELFGQVLEDHMVADVSVASLLSGGIDSSLIVALLTEDVGVHLPSYSVGFEDDAYDETSFAREVADHCGLPHHVLRIRAGESEVETVRTVIDHFDQPFADSSAIPFFLLSREIRAHQKVALSGDGADELFGGYENFLRAPWLHRLGLLPDSLLSAMEGAVTGLTGGTNLGRRAGKALRFAQMDRQELLFGLQTYFDEDEKRALYRPEFGAQIGDYRTSERYRIEAGQRCTSVVNEMTLLKLRYNLHADMLRKVDMMSMAHGLEIRVPFLDPRIVDFASRLPFRFKTRGSTNKYLLRRTAATVLPRRVARKPKWGFGIPLDTWSSREFIGFLRDSLIGSESRILEIVRRDPVEALLQAFEERRRPSGLSRHGVYQRVYQLLAVERWLRRWSPSF